MLTSRYIFISQTKIFGQNKTFVLLIVANKNDSLFRKKGRFEGVNLGDVFFCQFSKAKSYVVAIGLEIRTAANCDGKKLEKIFEDLLKFANIIDSNT